MATASEKKQSKESYTSLRVAVQRNLDLCQANLPFFDMAREVCRQWSDGEHVLMGAIVTGLLKAHELGLKGVHPERTTTYVPTEKVDWSDGLFTVSDRPEMHELPAAPVKRVGRTLHARHVAAQESPEEVAPRRVSRTPAPAPEVPVRRVSRSR